MMKHFYPGGSLLYEDNSAIHRAEGVTEWFDEHENDVTRVWPQSPDLNPVGHTYSMRDLGPTCWSPPAHSDQLTQ